MKLLIENTWDLKVKPPVEVSIKKLFNRGWVYPKMRQMQLFEANIFKLFW